MLQVREILELKLLNQIWQEKCLQKWEICNVYTQFS